MQFVDSAGLQREISRVRAGDVDGLGLAGWSHKVVTDSMLLAMMLFEDLRFASRQSQAASPLIYGAVLIPIPRLSARAVADRV